MTKRGSGAILLNSCESNSCEVKSCVGKGFGNGEDAVSRVEGGIRVKTHRIMRYINRTFRVGKLYRNARLSEIGLEGSDQPFLLTLCREPGISQDQLAKEIYIDKSAVARKLAALEKNGYVRRESDPDDKRVLRVYPTEKATALQPAIGVTLADWNELITKGFSEEEKETLETLLIRVMENAMAWADGENR